MSASQAHVARPSENSPPQASPANATASSDAPIAAISPIPREARQLISSQLELAELLSTMLDQIRHIIGAQRGAIFLCDEERKELWSPVILGSVPSEIRFPANSGVAGSVMVSGEVLNIPDAYQDPRFNPDIDRKTGIKTRNILCVPMEDPQGVRIGVIQLINKLDGQFSHQDENLLRLLASNASIGIENAQMYQQVSALRQQERALQEQLQVQHRQLQEAYLKMEGTNVQLSDQLRNRRWTRRLALGLAASLVLGLGGYFALGQQLGDLEAFTQELVGGGSTGGASLEAADAQSIPVTSRRVTRWLNLRGAVRPLDWIEIPSPLSATVQEINFRYDQPVRQGQLLARLNTSELQAQLRSDNAAYIRALSERERLADWANSTEVNRARRDIIRAQEALGRARRQLASTQELFDIGIVSRQELEGEKLAIKEAQAGVVAARENLANALAQGHETQLKIAELELQNAEQKLRATEAQIAQASIYSPSNGIIFPSVAGKQAEDGQAQQQIHQGSAVSQNNVMFAIANTAGIAIDAEVSEQEVLQLERGQPVRVQIEALPGNELEGEIQFVAGRGTIGERRNTEAKFSVTVWVTDIDKALHEQIRLGMSATAKVKIYDNPEAVVIPFEAVTVSGGGRYTVAVVDASGKASQRAISVQATLLDGIEVAEGLSPGERLLVPDTMVGEG